MWVGLVRSGEGLGRTKAEEGRVCSLRLAAVGLDHVSCTFRFRARLDLMLLALLGLRLLHLD